MKSNAIEYPIVWDYLIITSHAQGLENALRTRFGTREYHLSLSKSNRTYTSYNFSLQVSSQQERDSIFRALCEIECVKIVI